MNSGPYDRYGKRAFDIVLASLLSLLLMPLVLLVLLPLAVEHKGALLISQIRFGTGQYIKIFKLRTIRGSRSEDTGEMVAHISPIGRLVRWFGLDEYPQLLQVILGQMSIVGPRPLIREEAERLTYSASYRACKKGLITPAFLRRIGVCKDADAAELAYCEKPKTFSFDLRLIWQVICFVLVRFRRGSLRQTALVRRRKHNDQNLPGWKQESSEVSRKETE